MGYIPLPLSAGEFTWTMNAVIREVDRPQKPMSGNATYRALVLNAAILLVLSQREHATDSLSVGEFFITLIGCKTERAGAENHYPFVLAGVGLDEINRHHRERNLLR